MKRLTAVAPLAALSLVFLAACSFLESEAEAEHGGEHALVVVVRDSLGALVAADTVHWSYAADAHAEVHAKNGLASHGDASDTVKHGATRLSDSGSVWKIADHVHGSLYLRAARDTPHPMVPGCRLSGYAVQHFSADTLSDTVSLTLKTRTVCPII